MRHSEITPCVLERANWTYRTIGFVQNQVEFSTSILGRRTAYYFCMVLSGRTPSLTVMRHLRETTKTIIASFLGNGIEGRPGELVVYACSGYPCEGQFDATEFRIRDSVYLDVVSYLRYLQPHYPGELAGAFVSEENGCKVRYYGMRVKLLGLYPQITQAVCQPINGNNAEAVLADLAGIELR